MLSFKPTLSLVFVSLLVVLSNVDNQVKASLQVQSSRNIKVHDNLIQRMAQDEADQSLELRANDDDDDDEDCDDDEEEEEKKKAQEEAEAKKKAEEAKEKKEKAAKAKAAKASSSSKAAASKSSAAAKSSKAAKASSKSVASASHASVASVSSVSAASVESVASVSSVAAASSAREAYALQQHATPTALGDNVGLASKMQANANSAFNIQPQSLLSVVAAVGLGSLLVL